MRQVLVLRGDAVRVLRMCAQTSYLARQDVRVCGKLGTCAFSCADAWKLCMCVEAVHLHVVGVVEAAKEG